MLLLAIPTFWPYGYFIILRWVVTGVALYLAYSAYEGGKMGWTWTMGIIAVLFNPIAPIYLTKDVWIAIDIIAALIFLSSIKFLSFEPANQTQQRNENLERLRELFDSQEEVRNDDVEGLLGVSHATATRYLDELEKEGFIEQKGKVGRGVTYLKK